MDDDEIVVTWRAAIVPKNGMQPMHGRLSKIGRGRAVMKMEHNLQPGDHCTLAVMLPKRHPEEPSQFFEGRGVVALSVLSAAHFYVTLEKLKLAGNGEALLRERIESHRQVWKKP